MPPQIPATGPMQQHPDWELIREHMILAQQAQNQQQMMIAQANANAALASAYYQRNNNSGLIATHLQAAQSSLAAVPPSPPVNDASAHIGVALTLLPASGTVYQ